jgi:hypothetical protein
MRADRFVAFAFIVYSLVRDHGSLAASQVI